MNNGYNELLLLLSPVGKSPPVESVLSRQVHVLPGRGSAPPPGGEAVRSPVLRNARELSLLHAAGPRGGELWVRIGRELWVRTPGELWVRIGREDMMIREAQAE